MAGSTSRRGDVDKQLRKLNRFLVYPRYNQPKRLQNNLAILFWTEPLILGATVRPVALPGQGITFPNGLLGNITGWGYAGGRLPWTDHLISATVPVVDNDDCNQPTKYNGAISSDMLCAGLAEGGVASCGGDA